MKEENWTMVKCADCALLEGYHIDIWNEYVYRCKKFRTLRMRTDVDIGICPYFESKRKKTSELRARKLKMP